MRISFVLAALATLNAGSVQALSCVRPDPTLVYNWAHVSEDLYYAAVGRIEFTSRAQREDGPQEFSATLVGKSLTTNGFTADIATPLTVKTTCAGPWCGGLAPGQDYLMVLRQDDGAFVLDVGPCPTTTMANPTARQIQTFENCAKGKSCIAGR